MNEKHPHLHFDFALEDVTDNDTQQHHDATRRAFAAGCIAGVVVACVGIALGFALLSING